MEAAAEDADSGIAGRAGEYIGEEPSVGEKGGLRAENVYEVVVALDTAKGGRVCPAPLCGIISGEEEFLPVCLSFQERGLPFPGIAEGHVELKLR